jgi:hypothetical protein
MLKFYNKYFMSNNKLMNRINMLLWCILSITSTIGMFYGWNHSPIMIFLSICFWINAILTIICLIKFKKTTNKQ